MTQALLQLEGITQIFGGLVALDDVHIEVLPGEIHGLIGPNGAGKTTLLNVLTGIYQPNGGTVTIDGTEITGSRPDIVYEQGIARTFQNIRIWPQLSLKQNVMVGAYQGAEIRPWDVFLRPRQSRNRTVEMETASLAALDRFGLRSLADRPADGLPYGQRRLLEMARACVGEPRLLLLDEPVAGLNPVEVEELQIRIRSLRDMGMSILLIEHNMRFVMSLCDRVSVLHFGRRLTTGSPSAVQSDQEVIDAYLGSSEGLDDDLQEGGQ